MALLVTNDGAIELLTWQLEAALAVDAPLSIGLFVNDYFPVRASQFADLVQATFPGYYRQDVLRANWSAPVTVGGKAQSSYGSGPFEWTNTGGSVTVYGYFILNPATFKLPWLERFATPRVLAMGAKLQVQLVFTGVTEFG